MAVDLAVEDQFGPYVVYERLGVGGMATVHRALERGIEGFERIVALKRLLPHLAEDASFIKSFVREAKLASQLNHVNIVQIYELGRVGTEYFISMEHIDGRDIRRILRHARKVTGPPPIHITVGLLLQLCEALDYAHTKTDDKGQPLKLVHRDISPSNLLVTTVGHVKVIDFGIAKAQSSQLRTQTGRVKGKLAYMAPEAISGKELDSRSDLFAAGVIAHELLTARPLFASKNEYQTLLKVQRGDIIPPSTFNQACPPELDAIVLKALARNPDDRFSQARELRDLLLAIRRQYDLQTGHRDISQWLDWAFSLEPPTGSFASQHTFDQTGSKPFELAVAARAGKPVPERPERQDESRDEDEAVEIAWGGGEIVGNGTPIVLDDVPDVSAKHRAAAPRVEASDDLHDDIPASEPSHGELARVRDTKPDRVVAPTPERPAPRSTPSVISAASARVHDPDASGGVVVTSDASGGMVIRFTDGLAEAAPIARTTPGHHAPARTRMPTLDPLEEPAAPPARQHRPSSPPSAGPTMVTLPAGRKTWVILASIIAAGAVGTAAMLYATQRGKDAVPAVSEPVTPRPPGKGLATLKFAIEPANAEITIEDKKHAGSPWSIELPPGVHQIQIHASGYKARLTSLELSPDETYNLIISLDRIGAQTVSDANLILSSRPFGLEVILDGQLLAQHTPIKMPLKAGPHTIVLRQYGVEVWHHELVAEASVDYEFSPSLTDDKQRDRESRLARPPAQPDRRTSTAPQDSIVQPDRPAVAIIPPLEPIMAEGSGSARPAPSITLPPRPPPVAPVVPRPQPAIVQQGPVTIAPTAVTRVFGEAPTLGKSKRAEVPPIVAAKVCIDQSGRVTSVDMISKLERHAASDLANTMRSWRYTPYREGGVERSACFVVSFRVK